MMFELKNSETSYRQTQCEKFPNEKGPVPDLELLQCETQYCCSIVHPNPLGDITYPGKFCKVGMLQTSPVRSG